MSFAQHLATEWADAFNSHDLERILAHYRSDVRLTSPVYRAFSGGSATAEGLAELRRYFAFALVRFPDLRFTLLEAYPGAQSVAVRYHTSVGDRTCVEVMEFDADGRVGRVLCHYHGEAPALPGR